MDRILTTRELISLYGEILGPEFLRSLQGTNRQLADFLKRLPKIKFIKADRLFVRDVDVARTRDGRRTRDESELMVDRLSRDLQGEVQQVDIAYRETSIRLDSSLRRRLFELPMKQLSREELVEKNLQLDGLEKKLRAMGLLRQDLERVDVDSMRDGDLGQHNILLRDREEKLAVYSKIVAKAQRLLESLNKKLAPKVVRLDVKRGYQVHTADGCELSLADLSSGEQHELVLLHELLFDVPEGSLILIDEPELSLHVTWQVDLLPEILEIAKLSGVDFVLATHSPYIVEHHHNLMVRLGAPAS